MTAALLLLACRAVHPVPGVTPATVEGNRLVVEVPVGWELDRNRRSPMNEHLLLFNEKHNSAIQIDLVREDRSTRDLPLSLVTEGLALNGGRFMGITSEHNGTHELQVAGRDAWAVTTTRSHGPHERLISTVAVRGDRHLAILILNTATDAPVVVVQGWSQVLDSFQLPADPPPPLNLLDPLDEELGPI